MDIGQVKKLAQLARLSVPEAELEAIAQDMAAILGFVDEIQKVQIGDAAAIGMQRINVFRDDVVAPIQSVHDLVEAAGSHKDHFVSVPKVVGE